jgi:hypothetical protein
MGIELPKRDLTVAPMPAPAGAPANAVPAGDVQPAPGSVESSLSPAAPVPAAGVVHHGVVTVHGKQIEVNQGVAEYEGEKFIVTGPDHGNLVFDGDGKAIAHIVNGVVTDLTAEYLMDMNARGFLTGNQQNA